MRVVCFNIPTSGHVDPSLALAAGLIKRGHEVIYYLTSGYRQRVEATGATYRETPAIDDHYFAAVSRRFNPLRLSTQLLETTLEIAPHLARQMEKDQPEVIIYDSMCPWGHVTARQAQRPAIASMSLLDVPPTYLLQAGQLFTPLKLLPRFLPWLWPYHKARRHLQQTFHRQPAGLYESLNWAGDLNIVYTSPEIYPHADQLDESYVFTGPPMEALAVGIDFPFEDLNTERSKIYVSLGTVFNHNPTFWRDCVTAFRDADVQVVMTLGRGMPRDLVGDIPANFIVRDYVPQLQLLPHMDLFITHGGVNSVHQALFYGVPLLLVPQQLEQALVAARMSELGAGRILNRPDSRQLRRAAHEILNTPAYARRAKALGETLRQAGGISRAVEAIEALVGI